ncbi:MAG TPA: D-alanyl-D-alanine carboxypeptidase [Candidatus Ventrousia excrementavium]|uniref:serine-type D-Ala-D-Ala carboxypeptidase n=1 Tax=Candidatus Ventrousia excrementavium TaxID=2840961 RepID=A0A9D1LL74_9CLOT|nr:D-alanyl-D-alanine carboxypeptidase [Candidatus Ventrousia excrementavium]
MKRLLCITLACALLCGVPCAAEETAGLTVSAPSAVLMHPSGRVLYEKNAHEPLPPASVTKVMTLLLIMEALDEGAIALDDMVTGSAHAASMGGSQIWLKEGEQLTVDEMIKCIVVASANDCAVAMAEHIAGSEEAFVERMNTRAQELGMENTHFVNCCGLDADGHLTTAYDIALMSAELIKHEKIFDYTLIWQDTIRDGAFTLTNTNRLIRSYDGMTGLKTGSTSVAGFCLAGTARRDGLDLIAVVMKADTSGARNADITAMLNYGFANFASVTPTPDQPLMPIPVELGTQAEVPVELGEVQPILIEKSRLGELEKSIAMEESLRAPVAAGQQVGSMTVLAGGEVLQQVPIIAVQEVPFLGVWGIFRQMLQAICMRG